MAKSLTGGGVDFPIRASSDQLKSDLEQGKQLVKQAAQEMRATANVAINAPGDLGAATATAVRGGNVNAAYEQLKRRETNRRERESTRNSAIAMYQQDTGMVVRDRPQIQFERELSRQRAAESAERDAELGTGASYRGRGALARTNPRAVGLGEQLAGYASSPTAAAGALGAAGYVGFGMVRSGFQNYINSQIVGNDMSLMAAERARLASRGLNPSGLDADMRLRQSQGFQQQRENSYSIPVIGQLTRFADAVSGATKALDLEIKTRERATATTHAAIESQRESVLRIAEFKFGQRQNPIDVLKARQADEIAQLERAFAKDPTNTEAGIALDKRRSAQGEEMQFAKNVEAARQRRIGTNAQTERYRGAEAIARLRGNGVQEFAVRRAREHDEMEQSFRERIAQATPEEARTLREQRNQARFNFQIETQVQGRDLSLSRSGRAGSVAEAEIFGRLNSARYAGERQTGQAMADNAMRQLTEALRENTTEMKRQGGWSDD